LNLSRDELATVIAKSAYFEKRQILSSAIPYYQTIFRTKFFVTMGAIKLELKTLSTAIFKLEAWQATGSDRRQGPGRLLREKVDQSREGRKS
jgi:hypothetical protein